MNIDASKHEIPADVREGRRKNAEDTRESLEEDAEWAAADGGQDWSDSTMVVRWKSSGNAVPPSVFEDAFLSVPSGQAEQYEREQEAFLQEREEAAPETGATEELLDDLEEAGYVTRWIEDGDVYIVLLAGDDAPMKLDAEGVDALATMLW